MMQNITLLDYAILPFVLAFVYAIAIRYRNKHYHSGHPYRSYFIPAFTVKICGALFIGLIYEYYYGGGGDTMGYFHHAKIINSSLNDSVIKWINLILHIPNQTTIGYYNYISQMIWYGSDTSATSTYSAASITALLSLFTGNTYLPTAVLFAALSFTGVWALFRTFANIYPLFIKPIAIATLFIPSVAVWGSGIFKDTICIFGLGWLTFGVFQMLIQRNFKLTNIILTTISLVLVARVKMYILLAFTPALLFWVLSVYTDQMKNKAGKFLLKLTVFTIAIIGSYYTMTFLGEDSLGRYSLDNIEETAMRTRNWITYSTGDEGSTYDLGQMNGVADMFIKFPLAVNVTLFRPYLWEGKKVIILIAAIESALFLFLTIKLLFVVGIKRIFRTIASDPTLQFCLIFVLIFAFAVGVSTGNFGTLSRYKIPCTPFYAIFLGIMYQKNNLRFLKSTGKRFI
ncbi:hypothetical protein [Niabella beijingensis]|uniref:hypothetical protein n=1 Tax=Niabella beijingensis TaxID=2872700 RepID=UPI001CC072C4|nr:hypothetical protein [Niabella beijingensis]MBZ4190007.1 hypothetical protein [Niabella beijingensis]